MTRLSKTFTGVFLTVILIAGCAENKATKEDKPQNQIEFWKQKIADTGNTPKVFYHLYYGEQYENNKWVTEKPAESDDYFIGEKVSFWSDGKSGSYFELERTSPSGDWSIFSKNYYSPDKKLNLVLWVMNTTQSQSGAITVERKLTFDSSGILTRKCESVFQMDSKKPVEKSNYLDQKVKYWKAVNALPFINLL
jgi:hypothetical protein